MGDAGSSITCSTFGDLADVTTPSTTPLAADASGSTGDHVPSFATDTLVTAGVARTDWSSDSKNLKWTNQNTSFWREMRTRPFGVIVAGMAFGKWDSANLGNVRSCEYMFRSQSIVGGRIGRLLRELLCAFDSTMKEE